MTGTNKGRSDLAAIDEQLLALLAARVKQVAALDPTASDPLNVPAHPSQESLMGISESLGLDPQAALVWLRHAASICAMATATRQPVAYLGPIYSYSYLAAVKHFGLAAELVPVASIAAAFDEVVRGQSTYAVVPIENSTDGRVVDTLGRFANSQVEISGEVLLPVRHCLLGLGKRSDILEVHSKPQALSQCRDWLAEHLPQAKLVEVSSTATAAMHAAEDQSTAAIASREAGIHHGLLLIDENIEDNSQNVTRFAVIGGKRKPATGYDKTSLMFQLPHQPGALADAMVTFRSAEVNLTWIESFPLPNCPSEYLFFVEHEGHRDDPRVAEAIVQLEQFALRLDVLGSYPRGAQ